MLNTRFWRLPLLAMAMAALLFGLWAGLLRIGWAWPVLRPTLPISHGPLMVSGFLGTLIILERAVVLNRLWAYFGVLSSGLGGLLLAAGVGGIAGPVLLTLGSLWLCLIFAVFLRQHPALHSAVMAAGALSWLVGCLLWLFGAAVYQVVLWWMGFLVLTIAGERLELNRVLRLTQTVQRLFAVIVVLLALGLALSIARPDLGMRLSGLGMLALALWLLRYDLSRRTIRSSGVTRYIAACLLGGYIWLGFAGVLAMWYGYLPAGPYYDAILHAVFVGFVFSMIFGHALVIFPAILGTPLAYHAVFYAPLSLLHLSLVLRMFGNFAFEPWARLSGGLLNAIAILVFMGLIASSVFRSRQKQKVDRSH
jgi:hypothetical protein